MSWIELWWWSWPLRTALTLWFFAWLHRAIPDPPMRHVEPRYEDNWAEAMAFAEYGIDL